MSLSYDHARAKYRPKHIKYLLIAESPPPPPDVQSSRQFYYTDRIRRDDRLFVNTIKALYPEAEDLKEPQLQADKENWLKRFAADGWYMIEALIDSQEHEVTKRERQAKIADALPDLVKRLKLLVKGDTKIILLKSNVFEVAAAPLRVAGFNVLNTELVDYPGQFNQKAFREKLTRLITS